MASIIPRLLIPFTNRYPLGSTILHGRGLLFFGLGLREMESNRFLGQGDLLEEGELVAITKSKKTRDTLWGEEAGHNSAKNPQKTPANPVTPKSSAPLLKNMVSYPPPQTHTSLKQPFLGDFEKEKYTPPPPLWNNIFEENGKNQKVAEFALESPPPQMRSFGRAPPDLAPLPRGASGEFLAQNLDLARSPPRL